MLANLIEESRELFDYDNEAISAYRKYEDFLLDHVNTKMESRDDIHDLIGGNAFDILENNHENHIKFMTSVIKFKQYAMLVRTLPWVYHAYSSRGFEMNYFRIELEYWIHGMKITGEHDLAPIIKIYKQMLKWHDIFAEICTNEAVMQFLMDTEWSILHEELMENLLRGEHKPVIRLLEDHFDLENDCAKVYVDVFQPIMYKVGELWEKSKISVAHEHLAASTLTRVMATMHLDHEPKTCFKGDVIISTSTNEFHQLGARMVADLLENDGWCVRFLGADLPLESISPLLDQINPAFIVLSATMAYNVDRVVEIVKFIRSKEKWKKTKIMVGGIAVNNNPMLQEVIGADAYPVNAIESVSVANRWYSIGNILYRDEA